MAQQDQVFPSVYAPNFIFPIRDLENERVKVTLFDPAVYAKEFLGKTGAYPELFTYFAAGPFSSLDEFTNGFVEETIGKDPGAVLFVILDKTSGTLRIAGMVALINSSLVNQTTEIGYVMVLPEFHRTHITSNAVGLLLHYCLDLPACSVKGQQLKYGPGLGLRRVQWQAHSENVPSVRTAERMGFRREGILRWHRVLPKGKTGSPISDERDPLYAGAGRHTCILSVCWDDWEIEGGNELTRQQMDRVSQNSE